MLNTNGLQAEPVLRHGNLWNAAKEIGVDLIVISSTDIPGWGPLLLGSTADRVLQYAPCPVLVIRP